MRRLVLPAFIVVEVVFFAFIGGAEFHSAGEAARYFSSYFRDLFVQSVPVLLLAFGMTLVLMTAGIDLSVGSMTALIACAMASFDGGSAFWFKALPLGLVLAIALGAANGTLIARLDIPPIIATLGTMILFRGLCFVIMGDVEKAPFIDTPGYESLAGVPASAIFVVAVYVALGALLHRSIWLREILMLGGNRVAARYAGISVTRHTIEIYALMGALAFLTALSFTARNSSVTASSLTGLELRVIVAVVLGGTSVRGGGGSFLGSFFGVLAIAALDEGLRGATTWGDRHLPFKISHLNFILLGVLLIAGVWIGSRLKERVAR